MSAFAIFYYVDVLKVPAAKITLVMTWYGVWNAINDPLCSVRFRIRRGQGGKADSVHTLPYTAAFVLRRAALMPPASQSLHIYYFAVIFLFDGLFTIVVLN